jgi:type IV pilus assembly protein PilC
MMEAGVTLLRSLDVIVSQIESERFHKIVIQLRNDVEQGSSFSQALEKHPKVFNQFWVSLIEVGEASGTMPLVLNKLSFYLEQSAAFKSTIISAIIYPVILFVVACSAIMFFAFWVAPKFESIFNVLGADLPLITKLLLQSFKFMKAKFFHITAIIAVIVFLFRNYFKTYHGRLNLEKFLFSLPKIGDIIKLIVIERFTSQMAILIESGVPILHALDITQRLVNNNTCALIINDIKDEVRAGKVLVEPMEKSGFFPALAIQMIIVGEETGELSKMLNHVATFYQTTVETFMKRIGTIIEPVMLIFMGGVIGIIVIAMFLPMFNMASMGGG